MNIMSMPMPSDAELFQLKICDQMKRFDGSSNEDLFAPIPLGRGSGTGSPASLEATAVRRPSTASSCGGDGSCSAEDASKSFPIVLHAIISEAESDCIHWLPCGTRFVIANKEVFSRDVLPRYFGGRGGATTKFTSFTRRLKRWNFSRVPSGREMGAYYHEKFRRGEFELAKTITYPISKSVIKSPPGGNGKVSGKPNVPKASIRKTNISKASISKAQRRASTGSIMAPSSKASSGSVRSEAAALDCISPTPIKASLDAVDVPLPMLENDLKNWLTSADFMEGGGPSTNNDTPVDAEPTSVVSNPFLLPPPAFPRSVMPGGSQAGGAGGGMMKPVCMRRHSTTAAPTMFMPMMATSNNVTNSFASSQLLGPSFPCNNQMSLGAPVSSMSFASNTIAAPTAAEQNEPRRPQKIEVGSFDDGGLKEPSNMSREFSFGDLKMIDPFT